MSVVRRTLVPFSVVAAVVAWAELLHWRASRRGVSRPGRRAGTEAVVVLGYQNRGLRANYVNRYRVRAALRSIDQTAEVSRLVFCGGSVGGVIPEADLMARYATAELGYTGPISLERDSTTTWQNVQYAIALIEGADTVKIVSNSLHAEKARAYLWSQRPDLAARLVRAAEHRFGEITLLKPLAAVIGLGRRRLAPTVDVVRER